jgi:hypothetical protein
MKKFFLFLLFLILLIGVVNAQEEEAKYNFGSAQSAKELSIAPGDEVTTKLYFYNIHGNRITHISLEVGEAPKNWNIAIEPALHKTTVSVSGVPTTIEENLYVEPGSDVAESIPSNVSEGIEYISSPVGFVGAKPVKIKIKVPSDEKLGTVANVRIDAVASWLGQTGTAAITQGRSFEYKVTVVSKEFTETILEKAPEKKEEKVSVPLAPQVAEKEAKVGVSTSMFIGVVVILLIIIAGMFIFFVMKKK